MKKISELWNTHGKPDEKSVQCHVCAHHCIIPSDKQGFCRTRQNIDGVLYTLIYGSAISPGSVDPIEKKPLYHFHPNSKAFSIATIGCNLRCKHCQNWHISKSYPDSNGELALYAEKDKKDLNARSFPLTFITPEQVISQAIRTKSDVIAYTYNEPLIWFEFVKDTSILARENGIKNVLVTGGYSSDEANKEYIKFIDAANIDIKGFSNRFYKKIVGVPDFKPVLDTAKFFNDNGVHVEITNLIIPNENDDMDEIQALIDWVFKELGPDIPLHFSAYHPSYHINHPRTPSTVLRKAWKLATDTGLNYVYMGNVLSNEGQNTNCPKCGEILIQRSGYRIKQTGLTTKNTCGNCGESIRIIGSFLNSERKFF
ncbi:MAG: AmmeMemoRadiSam system radical SAM enzyme [Spirochaetes bacterium]|nr:AmmeMemoRadiSam system radical SAM enzyme [Spirochaetota bacterium]